MRESLEWTDGNGTEGVRTRKWPAEEEETEVQKVGSREWTERREEVGNERLGVQGSRDSAELKGIDGQGERVPGVGTEGQS